MSASKKNNHNINNERKRIFGDTDIGDDNEKLLNEIVVVVDENNDTDAVVVNGGDDDSIIGNNNLVINNNDDIDTNGTDYSHVDGTNHQMNHQTNDNGDDSEVNTDHDTYNSEPDDDEDDYFDERYDPINDEGPLIQAICREQPESTILELIHLNPNDVEQMTNDSGEYPLHLACKIHEYSNVTLKLIGIYPEAVHEANIDGEYPLHFALKRSQDERVIMKLIEIYPLVVRQLTLDYEKNNYYPLHLALTYHPSDNVIFKLLDIFPKAVSFKTERKGYALHNACFHGRSVAIIKKLLEIYPIAIQETNCIGHYPLHCVFDHTTCPSNDIIKFVLDSYPLEVEQQNNLGNTPLHSSILHLGIFGEDIFECMIQNTSRKRINVKNTCGFTPFNYACHRVFVDFYRPEILNLKIEMIDKFFIQHPDINVNTYTNNGITPLHTAADGGCLLLVQKILDHPHIWIDKRNQNHNQTPLEEVEKCIQRDQSWREPLLQIELVKIKNLLVEFPIKRRWQSYQYFLNNSV